MWCPFQLSISYRKSGLKRNWHLHSLNLSSLIPLTNIYWAHTLYQTQLKIQCWAEQISSDQRNAGKYWKLALQRWRETWFVPFANFCGVNTSPTTGFKLTTYEMACKISENLTIGFCEQLWPSSAHHCGAGPQCLPPSGGCCNTE